ncbi:RagB/SusD family nutrient uptake outer membrane protein [Flavivirga spongiicola]|uniref:RagB/SusD family nutrient uptake outer membrane protein n=1 Tax=Flavivirga spongiicola TaxID=421621 RepID=A0ABU7XPB7_9FLAO|nr:RagB/SusD family nutrient uptake outer membrane protein [Flavivirga sp. MEBiC05379]MDO5977605.1 RagB/SusD family nutrient uptake outer membrane protein [Flavivirga sp. MEBiC05379]
MKKIFLNIVLMAFLFISCSDDLLEQVPNNKLSTENFIPNLALTAVYDGLQHNFTGLSWMWQMGYSPLASNRYDADQRFNGNIESGVGLDPSTRGFQRFWQGNYELIFKANFFLDNAKPTEDFDQNEIDNFIAQAKFIRAFAYSQLAVFFGDIPLQLTSKTPVSELREVVKNSKAEVIEQVLKDLDEAIPNLPVNVEKGRISKGAALGLKARVLLRENDYPGVLAATNQIIDMGIYGLFGETSPGVFAPNAYKDLWKFENEGSEEAVFDIQFEGPNLNEGQAYETYGSMRTARVGYEWFWATKFLVDQYENIDGTPVDTAPYAFDDARFQGRDYRFGATITYPGKLLYNGQIWGPGYPIYARAKTNLLITKYVWETDDASIAGVFDSPINYTLIRYADILLMNAEAKIETNDIANSGPNSAINSINSIRARGGLQPTTATTQEELRAAVRQERKIEFVGEGLYMFDIRRWGIADVEMERDVERYDGLVTHPRTYSPKLLEWPIPQYDIDNTEGLIQNPLWQ